MEHISFVKKLKSEQRIYEESFLTLEDTLNFLEEEKLLMDSMLRYQPNNKELLEKEKNLTTEIETLKPTYEIFKTTKDVYSKKLDEIILKINEEIKREIQKAII